MFTKIQLHFFKCYSFTTCLGIIMHTLFAIKKYHCGHPNEVEKLGKEK